MFKTKSNNISSKSECRIMIGMRIIIRGTRKEKKVYNLALNRSMSEESLISSGRFCKDSHCQNFTVQHPLNYLHHCTTH